MGDRRGAGGAQERASMHEAIRVEVERLHHYDYMMEKIDFTPSSATERGLQAAEGAMASLRMEA